MPFVTRFLSEMDWTRWIVSGAVGVVVYLVVRTFGPSNDVMHLPTPESPDWIYGHELQAFEGEVQVVHSRWMRKLGSAIRLKAAFFHPDILVITDNVALTHIFQNCYRYVKSPVFRAPIKNLLGEGIVWAEDDMHRLHRRILSSAFSSEAVKETTPAVREESNKLCQRLTDHIRKSSSTPCIVDIPGWLSATTLDIIGRIGFNHDFQAGQSPEAKAIIATWAKHVAEGITSVGFFGPLMLRTAPWITKLPIKALKAQGQINIIIGKLARQLIERERVAGVTLEGKDILSRLMRTNQLEPEQLPDQQLIDNIVTLVMVGHETVVGVLNFALLELAQNLQTQEKLRTELAEASSDPSWLDYNNINKLVYLDAVTKESFRLHPSSPRTERVLLTDDVLPLRVPVKMPYGKVLTSLRLKAGQVIHIPFITAHTLPTIWGNDSYRFVPERWLDEARLPKVGERFHGWSNLITFIDGPRSCIGYRLAIYEFKVILADLILNFAFEPTDVKIEAKLPQTLQPVANGKAGSLPIKISLVS